MTELQPCPFCGGKAKLIFQTKVIHWFSLPNAAELARELRRCAKSQGAYIAITAMEQAADAIEALLAENAKLKAEKNDISTVLINDMVPRRMFDNVCAQRDELKAERDAAVEDIRRSCETCKHFGRLTCCECEWEWRGEEHLRGATKMIKEKDNG